MANKTRKRLWPVSLVMAVAVVGVVAAFLVMASSPTNTQAHGGASGSTHCDDLGFIGSIAHDEDPNNDHDCATGPTAPPPIDPTDPMAPDAKVTSSSTSASSGPELQLTIGSLPMDMAVGSSIVLYLEDDFAEPDSISASSVYIVATGGDQYEQLTTGDGSRVYVTIAPKLKTNDYFDPDKNDISVQVLVPDMCPNATGACEGDDGLHMGQTVTVVIESDSGIKNPPEEGTHSTGYALLSPTQRVSSTFTSLNTLRTWSKIALNDVDNKRGFELTVAGSGFNNGTTAGAYVLNRAPVAHGGDDMYHGTVAAWWDSLDCPAMVAAVGSGAAGNNGMEDMTNPYCAMYADLSDDDVFAVGQPYESPKDVVKRVFKSHQCNDILNNGTNAGGALVGSNDKVNAVFEVTVPTFSRGEDNWICMIDGEGRRSYTDLEDFHLQPSIAVVPSSVSTGDTVNVFARDYPGTGAWDAGSLKIGGRNTAPNGVALEDFIDDRESIRDGSGSITFRVPGGYDGVLRIDASWGGEDENTKITIGGAELIVSKTAVLPNETITITGNGMGVQTCIPESQITLDNVPVVVHEDSLAERCDDRGVEVSNSGQFVATIILWPAALNPQSNPALIPGTHKLRVEDSANFESDVDLTIAEPSITVTPDIAGPRDYITITGENWAVDNLDRSLTDPITVEVLDLGNSGRTYPVYADGVGRFTVEHRIHRKVNIPDTVQVKANYGEGRVVKISSFAVPASTITVTPNEGQPGDMVTLTASNMPVYTEAKYVEIGGTTYDNPGVNTDRDGNITVEDVLIPGLDPGVYSVVIKVQDTIAIGEVKVLAESSAAGAPSELPGAVESLGDSLVAIFHFDDVGKVWTFYDPRPDFAELNTLTEMVNGEAYWILVSETVEDVVLNNKVRSLTCRGSDCWNLEVW